MRMRFEPEDETAYLTRRDEIGEQFDAWLRAQRVPGDPNDAGLLMDWKWGYGDGELDRWLVDDVSEFLLEWCPRKLSASPADSKEIPASVAAFVEFLAHTGLLRGGDPPSRIRAFCEKNTTRFVREMGDPSNFGMAKSLFGGAALGDESDTVEPFTGLFDDPRVDGEQPKAGPVRLPDDDERRASARAAPLLATVRALAAYCADPGRTLTKKGNLRLSDARHLVEHLATGDDPTAGGFRTLTTAEDLPELGRILRVALGAGAVRRHRGRLVAVGRFAGLDDLAAHEKIVAASFEVGLGGWLPFGVFAQIDELLDTCVPALLSPLLTGGEIEVDELDDAIAELLHGAAPGVSALLSGTDMVRGRLDRLAALGLVVLHDETVEHCPEGEDEHRTGGHVTLTPAGVHTLVEQAREAGAEVLIRPDPAAASASEIVDLGGTIDEQEWMEDVRAWHAAQPVPVVATGELADAVAAGHREPLAVVAGLGMVAELGGEHAVEIVRRHLEGPQDGLVLHWLLDRSAIAPSTVEPARFLTGLIDVLAAALDGSGPDEMITALQDGSPEQQLDMLGTVWRLDHPCLPEVLEAVGSGHPVKSVAKAARKAAVKHRSMLADRNASRSRSGASRS
ncbi:MAG: hypothetical protein M3235_10810 [Actinomycetota bacterium]|nr:hypothetical protein [Actinomycetota bacterium]